MHSPADDSGQDLEARSTEPLQAIVDVTNAIEPDLVLGRRLTPSIVAIDGPAASGKSTVGRRLADALGYLFFDTGMMYRALTWTALERGLDVRDSEVMGDLAESVSLDIVPVRSLAETSTASAILVDSRDVTQYIRGSAVDQAVSAVSAHARVRAALSKCQRSVAHKYGEGEREKSGIVMVGRDIGTVVVKNAPIKVYLDATAEERARRRHEESRDMGKSTTYESVLSDIERRDELDRNRDHAPLSVADDAVVVDTTGLTADQVVDSVLGLIRTAVQVS